MRLVKSKLIQKIIFLIFLSLLLSGKAIALEPKDIPAIGLAFLTNLGIHEAGHYILADQVGAEGNNLNFFKKDRDSFFLGLSTVTDIDDKAKPAYHLAGEVASSYTFEVTLKQYRAQKTTYNSALLFFSMTDFLWYTTYAFYLTPNENEKFDPIGISETTGLKRETIFLVSLTQSALNALRMYSNEDRLIPYFIMDRYFIAFGVKAPF